MWQLFVKKKVDAADSGLFILVGLFTSQNTGQPA